MHDPERCPVPDPTPSLPPARHVVAVAMTLLVAAIHLGSAATLRAVQGTDPHAADLETAEPAVPDEVLLDVPYLPQTRALCGGAAAAMILRYWGDTAVGPRRFAHLVDETVDGIPTADLVDQLRGSGWATHAFRGSRSSVRRHLRQGRPLVTLLRDAPGRHHYVVVVAWSRNRVVYHDPATGPWRAVPADRFLDDWRAADSWTLLILPRRPPGPAATPEDPDAGEAERPSPDATSGGDCAARVERAVAAARSGGPDALGRAERHLRTAIRRCPDTAAPIRELAGVRIRQERPKESARLTERVVAIDPDDRHAWRILAASRYLEGDTVGALAAWNRVGEPVVSATRVRGLERTRPTVVTELLHRHVGATLEPGRLRRARRRLRELPFLLAGQVRYEPPTAGRTDLLVDVVERPLLPTGPVQLLGVAGRAVAERQLELSVSSPLGAGAVWRGSWRWSDDRPRVALDLHVPAPAGIGDLWSFELEREVETFAAPGGVRTPVAGEEILALSSHDDGSPRRVTRRSASLRVDGWASADLRWEVGAGWHEWDHRETRLSTGAAIEHHRADDRMALRFAGSVWTGLGARGHLRGAATGAWRSDADRREGAWLLRGGVAGVTASTTPDLWPGAGTGRARGALLRAHPLLDDDVLGGEAFGRALLHGSTEYRRWIGWLGPMRVAAAGFVDTARAWKRRAGRASAWHVDIGLGARLAIPGGSGTLRLDAARGLADGEIAFTVAWEQPWPGWRR